MIFANRLDPRPMIALGFLLQAVSGWQLARLDGNVGVADVFWPMLLQGFGVGLLWVPITVVTFASLPVHFVAEGTAIYHMVRNVGSSLYISLSAILAARLARVNYTELVPSISAYNEALRLPWVTGDWSLDDPAALAAIETEIARQSAMLGYLDSFWFFTLTALAVLPLVLLVRLRPSATGGQ
jgi:MFS transporter, DHA2 family, multidrug resistance protein